MGKFIDLTAADGFVFPAYVAEPAGKPKAAMVVCRRFSASIRTSRP
jgi:carboxymethylenebutenolidase